MGDGREPYPRASVDEIFRRFGYDPADPVRGRDVPKRLLDAIDDAPLLPDRAIGRVRTMRAARIVALRLLRNELRRWRV